MGVAIQRATQAALFTCWSWQLDNGHLTDRGLRALRARLDELSGEWIPGTDVELLRLWVADALGLDACDQLPDDISSIDDC